MEVKQLSDMSHELRNAETLAAGGGCAGVGAGGARAGGDIPPKTLVTMTHQQIFPELTCVWWYQDLGYSILSTGGTGKHLKANGVDCEIVLKIQEGRPNIGDLVKNGEVAMMLITSTGVLYCLMCLGPVNTSCMEDLYLLLCHEAACSKLLSCKTVGCIQAYIFASTHIEQRCVLQTLSGAGMAGLLIHKLQVVYMLDCSRLLSLLNHDEVLHLTQQQMSLKATRCMAKAGLSSLSVIST